MIKEFHYNESDLKGSANLIEDCKSHYVYLQNVSNDSDIDVIINGVKNNVDTVEIIKQLPNVTADNLHSIYCGIKDIRNSVPVDDKKIFERYLSNFLYENGFDLFEFDRCTLASKKIGISSNDNLSILYSLLGVFIKFCKSKKFDLVDLILNETDVV